jgi:acetyltransferase
MVQTPPNFLDPAHDVLAPERQELDLIFKPKSVAVIGATENPGSVGRTVFWNLISNPFGGTVFPVNPKRSGILGVKAYPTLREIPEKIDLAVVVTPAPSIPGIIKDCVSIGIKGAVIISAGFKEIGPEGAELERQILETARGGRMRVIGPNCLGVMSTISGLNATFASTIARPGNVGFLSQSGALCTAVLDWSLRENVGFSSFVSIGSMLDVGWGDLIYYLGNDPSTESIVIYMESIGDAHAFLSAAREVALRKPIIVIKPGRTAGAAKAAASHTGSLTGSDEVLEAAFQRCGVLRVNSISDLFSMSEVLGKQPRPNGPRLTILTNAGGPGVLATDALLTSGGQLAELTKETMTELDKILPTVWSHNNPVDVIGDASPERYAKALEIAAKDPNSDGLLVILTPQAMTDPTQTAEQLKPYAKSLGKPVIASWMGGTDVEAGESILNRAGIPTFAYPDTAAQVFNYMWQYTINLQALYEVPTLAGHGTDELFDRAAASKIIAGVRKSGRTLLTEFESKQLLAAYGIPTVETRIAATADEAAKAAKAIGFPVVLKLHSETITHKTDVGGVVLNLKTEAEVRAAFTQIQTSVRDKAGEGNFLGVTVQPMKKLEGYELILGSSIDPQFGPVLLFGLGGQLVEVFRDRALALPPLTTILARRMMEQTKIYKALKGVRGRKPVDLAALERLMVGFGQLVVEQRWIQEIDINPLLASSDQLIALDARVVLHPLETPEEKLPSLAITPYPAAYVLPWKSASGETLVVRPIRPEDEPLMVQFHESLSERSVFMRYLNPMVLDQRVSHSRLSRICFIDYDREMVLVAEQKNAGTGKREIVGTARLSKIPGTNDGRFSMIVNDQWQSRGLGSELLNRLVQVARDQRLERVLATMATDNQAMRHMCEKVGFKIETTQDPAMVKALLSL